MLFFWESCMSMLFWSSVCEKCEVFPCCVCDGEEEGPTSRPSCDKVSVCCLITKCVPSLPCFVGYRTAFFQFTEGIARHRCDRVGLAQSVLVKASCVVSPRLVLYIPGRTTGEGKYLKDGTGGYIVAKKLPPRSNLLIHL